MDLLSIQGLLTIDEILKNLVERMPTVKTSIGVWRSIVKTKRSFPAEAAASESLSYNPYSFQNCWISGSLTIAFARWLNPVSGRMIVAAKGFFGFFFLSPPFAERVVVVADVAALLTTDGRKEKALTPYLPLSANAERRNTIVASPMILIPFAMATA